MTRISHIGEASGSITTYETQLNLTYDERLMDGMNGSAVILSDSVQNVLVIPLNAIYEDENGAYVNRLDASGTQNKVYITTGLSDGYYAEVTSGLSEGDQIAYQCRAALPLSRISLNRTMLSPLEAEQHDSETDY